MDCNLPGSSVYGILQARILWRSSQPRNQTQEALSLRKLRENSLSFQYLSFSYFLFESHPQRIKETQAVTCQVPLDITFSSVQLLSHVRLFATPWTTALQASLSITSSRSWLKPMSIELVMPSNYLILFSHPLLLLPSIFPSIRVFSSESVLHIRWPKYWGFSFNISPSNQFQLQSFQSVSASVLPISFLWQRSV